MDLYRREALTELTEKILKPVKFQLGMQPSLHQQLRTAAVDQFLDLAEDLRIAEQIRFRVGFIAVKCAKLALSGTYVGVVNIAIDNKRDAPVRMPAPGAQRRPVCPE